MAKTKRVTRVKEEEEKQGTDAVDLDSISRPELQALAKQHGIMSNQKSAVLLELLRTALGIDGVGKIEPSEAVAGYGDQEVERAETEAIVVQEEQTATPSQKAEELERMSRPKVQAMAKQMGIKANQKTDELIRLIQAELQKSADREVERTIQKTSRKSQCSSNVPAKPDALEQSKSRTSGVQADTKRKSASAVSPRVNEKANIEAVPIQNELQRKRSSIRKCVGETVVETEQEIQKPRRSSHGRKSAVADVEMSASDASKPRSSKKASLGEVAQQKPQIESVADSTSYRIKRKRNDKNEEESRPAKRRAMGSSTRSLGGRKSIAEANLLSNIEEVKRAVSTSAKKASSSGVSHEEAAGFPARRKSSHGGGIADVPAVSTPRTRRSILKLEALEGPVTNTDVDEKCSPVVGTLKTGSLKSTTKSKRNLEIVSKIPKPSMPCVKVDDVPPVIEKATQSKRCSERLSNAADKLAKVSSSSSDCNTAYDLDKTTSLDDGFFDRRAQILSKRAIAGAAVRQGAKDKLKNTRRQAQAKAPTNKPTSKPTTTVTAPANTVPFTFNPPTKTTKPAAPVAATTSKAITTPSVRASPAVSAPPSSGGGSRAVSGAKKMLNSGKEGAKGGFKPHSGKLPPFEFDTRSMFNGQVGKQNTSDKHSHADKQASVSKQLLFKFQGSKENQPAQAESNAASTHDPKPKTPTREKASGVPRANIARSKVVAASSSNSVPKKRAYKPYVGKYEYKENSYKPLSVTEMEMKADMIEKTHGTHSETRSGHTHAILASSSHNAAPSHSVHHSGSKNKLKFTTYTLT